MPKTPTRRARRHGVDRPPRKLLKLAAEMQAPVIDAHNARQLEGLGAFKTALASSDLKDLAPFRAVKPPRPAR